jgi:arylsulfatase A-like enzyme
VIGLGSILMNIRRIRQSVTVTLLTAAAVTLLSACGGDANVSDNVTGSGKLAIQDIYSELAFSEMRVHWKEKGFQSWRDARKIPDRANIALKVDDIVPGSALQLGIMDAPGEPITIRYHIGSEPEKVRHTKGEGSWESLLLPLTATQSSPQTMYLQLVSDAAYYVSRARILPPALPKPDQPNVILVLIDTLRQDHLGFAGYPRPTSPNLDAFAHDAVTFADCWSQSSWTRPSVASLLTSSLPQTHGVEDRGDTLSGDVSWLPSLLRDTGYETYAVMTNPNCLPLWGFGRGFDQFADFDSTDIGHGDDVFAVDGAMAMIDHRASESPFFLYLHTLSPHEPYTPPEPYKSIFQGMEPTRPGIAAYHADRIDLYDAEIAYIDSLLGTFFDYLKKKDLYESSLIVVLSDHGEEFGDHGGISHGKTLYQEQLQIPLLMKFPHNTYGGTVYTHVSESIDIAPTLMEALHLPEQSEFEGMSLWSALRDDTPMKVLAYATLKLDRKSMQAVKTTSEKLIFDMTTSEKSWYDLKQILES